MTDEMFFSEDQKSLRRGRRTAARTATCRPCLVWPSDSPDISLQGVVLNINAHGMSIRMMDSLPAGTSVMIQMMRGDDFSNPLAGPVTAMVVRNIVRENGFIDHGMQILQQEMKKASERPLRFVPKPARAPERASRMHTIDYTVGRIGRRGER